MNLRVKLNLILIGVFAAVLTPTALITGNLLQRGARDQVLDNARIMMETAKAARTYTVDQVKPLLAPLIEKDFLPQSVPAYAATEIFKSLREQHPEYVYKEATLNPTNPVNRSSDWETDIVEKFRSNPEMKEWSGVRDTPLGQALYLSLPLRVTGAKCLDCHTTPDKAPASMVRKYGASGGYGWKLDEVVGAQIVQVPMSAPVRIADAAFRAVLFTLGGVFVVTLVALNLMLGIVVIRPVRRLAEMADRVSRGELDVEPTPTSATDEVAVLAGAFDRMRISLTKALGMLEGP
jgi:protein-histidine pros-kinase